MNTATFKPQSRHLEGVGENLLGAVSGALQKAWSKDTSFDPAGWSAQNPAWGQCAVTALILQDYLGGNLVAGQINGIEHYWNVMPDGQDFDLTRNQFRDIHSECRLRTIDRQAVLSFPATFRRYLTLSSRVVSNLADPKKAS